MFWTLELSGGRESAQHSLTPPLSQRVQMGWSFPASMVYGTWCASTVDLPSILPASRTTTSAAPPRSSAPRARPPSCTSSPWWRRRRRASETRGPLARKRRSRSRDAPGGTVQGRGGGVHYEGRKAVSELVLAVSNSVHIFTLSARRSTASGRTLEKSEISGVCSFLLLALTYFTLTRLHITGDPPS